MFDKANNIVPGTLSFSMVNSKTVAIWQVQDNITNRLAPNTEYTVFITKDIVNTSGIGLYNAWTSRFTTTGDALDDQSPPTLTLAVEPPVNPSYILPGQKVLVDAYAADQGSGVVRVELRMKDLTINDSSYQLVDRKVVFSGDKPPFIFTIDSGKLAPGHVYQLLATAYDYMMNSQDATINLIIAASAAPPTITLPSPPVEGIPQGISVTLTPDAVTGGVTEVRYYLDGATDPFKTVTLAPYQAGMGTLTLSLGEHAIKAVAVDGLNQTGEATYPFSLVTNPNKPQISLNGLTNGASYIVGSSFVVSGTATDPVGIASLSYYFDNTTGTPFATGSQPFTIATSSLSLGGHQIIAKAVNNLGVSSTEALIFNVVEEPNGPPPAAPVISSVSFPNNGLVTVTGTAGPSTRVDVTNTNLGITTSVYTDGNGNFSAGLPASAGHVISAVAYDFTISQSPSQAKTSIVQTPPVLQSISVSPSTTMSNPLTFTTANAYQDITVTGIYSDDSSFNLNPQAAFSSSDPSVATINSAGRIAGLKNGNAVITVKVTGMPDALVYVKVSVVTLTSITVDPSPVILTFISQTRQLTVTGNYSDGFSQSMSSGMSFVTGDVNVATVVSGGVVTAKGGGTTAITVYYPGVAPVSVNVNVTVQGTAPTINILSPANNTQVERQQNVTVVVRAQSNSGSVKQIALTASGQTSYFELKQISPVSLDTTQSFTFPVSSTAAIGGTISISVRATDTSDRISDTASLTLKVVDQTAPAVDITAPVSQSLYNFGDTVTITVNASDVVSVTSVRYAASGGVTVSESKVVSPGLPITTTTFSFKIPYGFTNPNVRIRAYAMDAAGNEGAASPIDIIVTSADIIAPQTEVISVTDPGSSTLTTVSYKVTSGLSDLDHVELYFRRNSLGTFNRYTDADNGNTEGKYVPPSGDTGTILFDSTKMGGDGTYEFYSVGVDKAGNREAAPMNTPASPKDYTGLIAYYPFNGTTLDESGQGNNGTANGGGFTTDRLGAANEAYLFNGSSNYIKIGAPVPASLQIQNELTLAAWIYVTQYPGSNTLGMIVGCQNDGTRAGYSIFLDGRTNPDGQTSPAGHIHFQMIDGHLGHHTNVNAQIPLNQWVHVAATRKANEAAKVYYNGILQSSTSGSWGGSITYNSSELDIGRQSDLGRYFNGVIDDVQIYNRALNEAEIKAFFSHVVPDKTTTFNAGTNWTVISSPATAGEGDGAYDNQNIRVNGTTFTVNGSHSFKNVELLNGAVLTHAAATTIYRDEA